jgi:hypothetical protein
LSELGHSLEQLEFAESGAAKGRERLNRLQQLLEAAAPQDRAKMSRLVENFAAIQHLHASIGPDWNGGPDQDICWSTGCLIVASTWTCANLLPLPMRCWLRWSWPEKLVRSIEPASTFPNPSRADELREPAKHCTTRSCHRIATSFGGELLPLTNQRLDPDFIADFIAKQKHRQADRDEHAKMKSKPCAISAMLRSSHIPTVLTASLLDGTVGAFKTPMQTGK